MVVRAGRRGECQSRSVVWLATSLQSARFAVRGTDGEGDGRVRHAGEDVDKRDTKESTSEKWSAVITLGDRVERSP